MPLGGASILWNESSPAESDIADAAPIRSIETSIRNAMGSEHNWPSTGGANVGFHLLGSARPFYDLESNVSSTGTDGRLMVTSDTSRFFHVGSGGTMFLGSQRAISAGSSPVGGQNFYWAAEFGSTNLAAGNTNFNFPNSGFSGIPFMQVSIETSSGVHGVVGQIFNLTATSVSVVGRVADTGAVVSNSATTLHWLSIGTRVL